MIRIPAAAPTSSEISLLSTWIQAGGLLLVFADYNYNTSPLNTLLAGVGSTMHYGGTMDQNMYLTSGLFLTDGVVGYGLGGTPGHQVVGGTALTQGGSSWSTSQKAAAASYIHFEQIGLGYIIAFGDLLDVNWFGITSTNARGKMFLNVGSYVNPRGGSKTAPTDPAPPSGGATGDPLVDPGGGLTESPEPSTVGLLGVGMLGVVALRRRAALRKGTAFRKGTA